MNLNEDTIGIQIREVIDHVRETVEAKLIEISEQNEWFVDVSYTCNVAVSNSGSTPIKDCLTVTIALYVDDENQGNHKFSFTSHEAIFLNDICNVMYKTTLNPENFSKIIFDAMVNVEYLR